MAGGVGPRGPRPRTCAQPRLCRLPQLAAAIGLVSEISQQLVERKNEAVSEIGSTFEELEKALQQRKGLLVRDLEAICGAKQKVALPTPAVLPRAATVTARHLQGRGRR